MEEGAGPCSERGGRPGCKGGARDPRGRADVAFGLIRHIFIHYI